jgi:hypothetical protein
MKKGGRIAGTPNKLTSAVRVKIESILNNCIENLDLNQLSNRERIELIGKLLPFVTPRYATIIESQAFKENSINPIEINL